MTTVSGSGIVETRTGKVQGAEESGIHSFKGIPYGAPTGGENRFMPPRPPAPWTGIREALEYGDMAPQTAGGAPVPSAINLGDAVGRESEDCLVLNVFTPGLHASRRPVMFWCHGGGFRNGSGGAAYDGSNLARRGDVVVVTINHRLNALGYLHLGDLDPTFAASGNVGMLDIVAALEWVRDNIEGFGGDPANVTIFGESGGGRKVAALLAMPPAQGLFHRAVIESGPGIRVNERGYATELAEMLLAELGLNGSQVRDLQQVPVEKFEAAQLAVAAKVPSTNAAGGFRPVIDPETLPAHPFDPVGPEMSRDVPVIVGFNRTEATLFLAGDHEAFELDDARLERRVERLFPNDGARILERYRALYPAATPSDIYFLVQTNYMRYAVDSIKLAERRAAQGGAPVYLYKFEWTTPARYGALRTPHALEIPFVFDNVAGPAWRGFTGGTPEAVALAARVSGTWAAFARTGDPNGAGLPEWRAYDSAERATMVINDESALVNDPARGERELWEEFYYRA